MYNVDYIIQVLSSPVRDLNHGLCKLSFGETINTWDFYSDKSVKMKLSLQSCLLQDTRKDSVVEKKLVSLIENFDCRKILLTIFY